jgi:UDP-galactopyranose mutase
MKVDCLIVGAGFTGAVLAERIASQLDKSILIVERRNHIAGNAFDEFDANGVLVHRYGPHIFHTNSNKVWTYLSKFTEWRPYYHRVCAIVEGKSIPLPFSLASLRVVFSQQLADRLESKLIAHYGYGSKIPILKLVEETDQDLNFLANFIYTNVFEKYTLKQWGVKPEELSPSVTSRVPVLISYDERYFQDTYQAIPREGYSSLFRKMLCHPKIHILLQTDFLDIQDSVKFDHLIYTGPIDRFFDYIHGELPYRSLRFEFISLPLSQYQCVAQVNYPNEYEYTRVTEFKHITGQEYLPHTTIAYEYPVPYVRDFNEPYYPIPKDENETIYQKYVNEASKLKHISFVGRLADYRYYNMDQAVARALKLFEDLAKKL